MTDLYNQIHAKVVEMLSLEIARQLCHKNPPISATLHDLLLDVLCYQTQPPNTHIPPPGLSQLGKDRLLSGTSTLEKTWMAKYANLGRLRDLKLANNTHGMNVVFVIKKKHDVITI